MSQPMGESSHAVRARLATAIQAADEAGKLILKYFATKTYSIDQKSDGSPVTTADRGAEGLITASIRQAFGSDEILGEESGRQHGTSGFRWIIDPIDGTASFVHGVPLFGTLIGIERDGAMVAGVIRMPALDETVYAAAGEGAWHQVGREAPVPARVSATTRLGDSMVCVTSFDYFAKSGKHAEFERLCSACRSMRGWSDCYSHILAATGRIDAVVEPSIHPWDVAAIIPIIAESGGRYSDWNGQTTVASPHGIVTNGTIHHELLQLLAPRTKLGPQS